jgi:transcriptional regulator of acetoin/glycerol metabolism
MCSEQLPILNAVCSRNVPTTASQQPVPKGKNPGRQPLDKGKIEAAIKLVESSVSPAEAAKQLGLGRSTVYREMRRLGGATSCLNGSARATPN